MDSDLADIKELLVLLLSVAMTQWLPYKKKRVLVVQGACWSVYRRINKIPEICFIYTKGNVGGADETNWQNAGTTGPGPWAPGHLLNLSLYFGMLENSHHTRGFGQVFLLWVFFFLTKMGKSKRQGAESDPALFLLEIFPIEPWLSSLQHTKSKSKCIMRCESGFKRRESAWFCTKQCVKDGYYNCPLSKPSNLTTSQLLLNTTGLTLQHSETL